MALAITNASKTIRQMCNLVTFSSADFATTMLNTSHKTKCLSLQCKKSTCIYETVIIQHWPNKTSDLSVNWPETHALSAHPYSLTLVLTPIYSFRICSLWLWHKKGRFKVYTDLCSELHIYATCNARINLADAVIHSHLQINNATA